MTDESGAFPSEWVAVGGVWSRVNRTDTFAV